MSDSLWPYGPYSPWNSPGQNTRVSSLSLIQGIFPTQGLKPGLPHCKRILYQLSHKGSPGILEGVAYLFSSRSSWPRNQTRVSCIAGRFFTRYLGSPLEPQSYINHLRLSAHLAFPLSFPYLYMHYIILELTYAHGQHHWQIFLTRSLEHTFLSKKITFYITLHWTTLVCIYTSKYISSCVCVRMYIYVCVCVYLQKDVELDIDVHIFYIYTFTYTSVNVYYNILWRESIIMYVYAICIYII